MSKKKVKVVDLLERSIDTMKIYGEAEVEVSILGIKIKKDKPYELELKLPFKLYSDENLLLCLKERNKEVHLARQCIKFKGSLCHNVDCKNISCQLHKDYDFDKRFLGDVK